MVNGSIWSSLIVWFLLRADNRWKQESNQILKGAEEFKHLMSSSVNE